MISCVAWVPRGAARATPLVTEPTAEELEALKARVAEGAVQNDADDDDFDEQSEDDDEEMALDSSGEGEDEGTAAAHARAAAAAVIGKSAPATGKGKGQSSAVADQLEAAMRELDMDNYDDSDEDGEDVVTRALGGARLEMEGDDPYITLGSDDEDSEAEEVHIKPTDLLILAARNEDDVNNLEVWVYEEAQSAEDEANVYVHHELMLPAFPLSVAWMDCNPRMDTQRCNMAAVSTLEPGIEIWDLDVLDALEPVATLGGIDKGSSSAAAEEEDDSMGQDKKSKKKKKKKSKSKKSALVPGSHEDSVLCLSWNREFRNVLASGSADKTVKVWDIMTQTAELTLKHHKDKVQAVVWNPAEAKVLLTGAFDRTAALVDVRTPGASPAKWSLSADCEALAWNPLDPTCFLTSAEDGIVACFDARKGAGSAPLFRLSAHDKPTCTMAFCPAVPGLLATASTDRHAKLWDISNGQPSLVASVDLQVGAIFSAGFSADAPHLLAVGGAEGSVTVWDIRAHQGVASRYPQLLKPAA